MKRLNKIRSNSKLGKALNESNSREFFSWMFYKGYVVSFKNYQDCLFKDNIVNTKWSIDQPITRDVVKEYEQTGNEFTTEANMYDMENGTYLLSKYFAYDGDVYDYTITTTSPITELYKEYEKISNKPYMWLVMYASMFYLPYGTYGDMFEDCGGLTFDDIVEAAKWYDTNANYVDGTPDRERLRDVLLYTKGNVSIYELEHGLWLKKVYLNEYVSKEDILLSWDHHIRVFHTDNIEDEIKKMRVRVVKDGWLEDAYEEINNIKKVA